MTGSRPTAAGRLAGALQEPLTAIVRLRAARPLDTDAATFRQNVTYLLQQAEQTALQSGFTPEDSRLAIFAVVALLDESALNSGIASLSDWARRPLQDELFGGHMAGEWFFQHIEQLLGRPDSPDLADLLEVHQLCLLLGFKGKYGAGDHGSLHAITSRVGDRLARMRGAPGDLAPSWRPPADRVDTTDPWLRRLGIAAMVAGIVAVGMWGIYSLTLRNTEDSTRALAPNVAAVR